MKETFEQYLERLHCSQVTFESVAKRLFETIELVKAVGEEIKVMEELYGKAEERIRELETAQLVSVTKENRLKAAIRRAIESEDSAWADDHLLEALGAE